ncbi:MAG TPA: glycoside hydrolase family 2 TIM barrel-domain containing protein, partial [Fodinibius sp.]|nr:glycoside hydrolase family 2 TIM barrel-domain containing protein [Fodinibius sp.]
MVFFITLLAPFITYAQEGNWQPADNPLMTRWAEDIDPDEPLSEYPRPQMKREEWTNLNGLWNYAIVPAFNEKPESWDGEILVPFGIESALSGVKKRVGPDNKLWYHTTFEVPDNLNSKRLLLHFGAVDWRTTVWINDKKMGQHEGGYTSFSFDISEALKAKGEQEITISVWDPTDDGYQPTGKQVRDPQGIYYTPTTGIWQTVWLESVPEAAIKDLKMTPDIDENILHLTVESNKSSSDYRVEAVAMENGTEVGKISGDLGTSLSLPVEDAKLWSPSNPFLYDLKVTLYNGDQKVDEVKSYFGMREVRLGEGPDGFTRLFLNDEPVFHYGLLDQGFWPDGIYSAPTDEALKYDIQVTKDLGFNMIRKHVKVEPNRWYYWADKMGVLVWQDMPNGDRHIGPDDDDINRTAQSAIDFKDELKDMINQLYNHISIVTWVPFNEGWGQFNTESIADFTANLDSTRFVDIPSGWADRGVGDFHDIHSYPGPDMPEPEEDRAAILGEFGGEALVVEDHLWIQDFSNAPSHYETSQSRKALHKTYERLLRELIKLKDKGLAGAVYTQTTDVESEVNGIMTYDREVIKFD